MTMPSRLADRITALGGSVDLSGFTPFFSPVMYFFSDNRWPTMTLMVSLVAILLTGYVVFRLAPLESLAPLPAVSLSLSIPGCAGFGWRPFAWNSRLLPGADHGNRP
jgi:hypothetical protein